MLKWEGVLLTRKEWTNVSAIHHNMETFCRIMKEEAAPEDGAFDWEDALFKKTQI